MKAITVIIIALLVMPCVLSQVTPLPPSDTSTIVIQKIDQEHKNTRKYFSDELTRQREEWTKSIDERADYYERTANQLVDTLTWKLGLIWAGVTFFILSINALLRTRIDKKKYEKLKKALVGETTEKMMEQLKEQQQLLENRFRSMQSESQTIMQDHMRRMQRMVTESKRPDTPPQTSQQTPPVMDFYGNPLNNVTFFKPEPAPQNALKPPQMAQERPLPQLGVPTPPPYAMPPAPRKLGFFERRRMKALEKELSVLEKQKQKQELSELKVKGELYKLNPLYGK